MPDLNAPAPAEPIRRNWAPSFGRLADRQLIEAFFTNGQIVADPRRAAVPLLRCAPDRALSFERGSAAQDFTEAIKLPWSHGNIPGKNRAQARPRKKCNLYQKLANKFP
jgi:hypothetical protein